MVFDTFRLLFRFVGVPAIRVSSNETAVPLSPIDSFYSILVQIRSVTRLIIASNWSGNNSKRGAMLSLSLTDEE
jgi:hypothetical protein